MLCDIKYYGKNKVGEGGRKLMKMWYELRKYGNV